MWAHRQWHLAFRGMARKIACPIARSYPSIGRLQTRKAPDRASRQQCNDKLLAGRLPNQQDIAFVVLNPCYHGHLLLWIKCGPFLIRHSSKGRFGGYHKRPSRCDFKVVGVRTLLGLPRIIRLKENSPELDYSSFRFGGKLRFRKLGMLFAHMGVGYVAAERMRQNIVPLEVRP
jgi:hypothetical protein